MAADITGEAATTSLAAGDRPDVFVSYAREDEVFVEGRLCAALVARGKDVWIDVEDIRGGAADWRANVWAGIETAKVVVFVLTPASAASGVCGEELRRAVELNKRIVPILRRPVETAALPAALERPNWIYARDEDDFEASVAALVDALELDEPWVEQHARFTQRTSEWLRNDRDRSYLLSGSDLRAAERWLDDRAGHREAPTADQVTYITAGRRAAARRAQLLLSGVAVALVATTVLAIVAFAAQKRAIDREKTANAQARAAQSIAALATDPERSLRRALDAVRVRSDDPEARYALRRAVSSVGWTALLRTGDDAAPLLDAEFAPGGEMVATGADDGSAAIWNARTGRATPLSGHRSAVNTAVFSPDGRQLVTASEDGTARTWDSASGRPQHTLNTRSRGVWAATYGRGGRLIATVSDRGAQIWDAASGRQIARLPSQRPGVEQGTIRLSPDGRRALTPAARAGDTTLWDVVTRRPVATLRGDGRNELRLTLISADSRRIVTIDERGAVSVWAAAGRRIARLPDRRGRLADADFSADGRLVVTAGRDGRAEVWRVSTRSRIALLPNGKPLVSAQFSPDGRHVVTGDEVGVGRVWRVAGARLVAVLRGHTAGIHRARFSADGRTVVSASDDGSARLWRARPVTPEDSRWQHAASTTFAPDSRHVLVHDGERRGVWDTATGGVVSLRGGIYPQPAVLAWPCGHAAGCSPWSPDSRHVAGANARGRAVVWDARTGAVERTFGPASGVVLAAALSPDGRQLATVDGSRPVAQIWDARTGRRLATVPKRPNDVLLSAQFVDRPLRLLTTDVTGVVQVSDPASGAGVVLARRGGAATIAARRDGRQLALGTLDGQLRLIAGAPPATPPRIQTRSATSAGPVSSLAYDRAGGAIATGGQKGTTRIWRAGTLRSTPLQAPGGTISGATFSPHGRLVLVTSQSTTRLWDVALERYILDLPATAAARAEFSPDARRIVLAGRTRLELHRCDACASLEQLARRARALLPQP